MITNEEAAAVLEHFSLNTVETVTYVPFDHLYDALRLYSSARAISPCPGCAPNQEGRYVFYVNAPPILVQMNIFSLEFNFECFVCRGKAWNKGKWDRRRLQKRYRRMRNEDDFLCSLGLRELLIYVLEGHSIFGKAKVSGFDIIGNKVDMRSIFGIIRKRWFQ